MLKKFLLIPVFLMLVIITPAFAEQVIFSEGKQYEIGEITSQYKLSKHSQILKTQGYTTTGEMFFLRVSPSFEYAMLLDTDGWHKAELREKTVAKLEPIIEKPKIGYQPELDIAVNHNFVTHWKQVFNINVIAYDTKINPSAKGFEGKLDDVDITMIISLGGEMIRTIKGVTEYGTWKASHYVEENLSKPGEYTIDMIATMGDQTVSKSSSMFIIGKVIKNSNTSNSSPVANAGPDQLLVGHPVNVILDGSGSSDPNGDTLEYTWIEVSSFGITLNNANTSTPDFDTVGSGDTYTFQLTVSDGAKTSTDTVTVTT